MPEITDIRPVSRGSRRRRVYLDGSEWRSVPAEVVRDLGLRVGQTQDADSLAARIAESEPTQAWERTLRLLNYRERGSGELRQRLLDDGYEAAVVEDVVSRAVDLGFLDDRRFAEGLARIAAGKRQGKRRIAAGLSAKHVDEALAADVLEAWCDPDAERERALTLARKLAARGGMDASRVAARLASRGFEAAVAWDVAREVSAAADEPSDER
jgi:regulatory protein